MAGSHRDESKEAKDTRIFPSSQEQFARNMVRNSGALGTFALVEDLYTSKNKATVPIIKLFVRREADIVKKFEPLAEVHYVLHMDEDKNKSKGWITPFPEDLERYTNQGKIKPFQKSDIDRLIQQLEGQNIKKQLIPVNQLYAPTKKTYFNKKFPEDFFDSLSNEEKYLANPSNLKEIEEFLGLIEPIAKKASPNFSPSFGGVYNTFARFLPEKKKEEIENKYFAVNALIVSPTKAFKDCDPNNNDSIQRAIETAINEILSAIGRLPGNDLFGKEVTDALSKHYRNQVDNYYKSKISANLEAGAGAGATPRPGGSSDSSE